MSYIPPEGFKPPQALSLPRQPKRKDHARSKPSSKPDPSPSPQQHQSSSTSTSSSAVPTPNWSQAPSFVPYGSAGAGYPFQTTGYPFQTHSSFASMHLQPQLSYGLPIQTYPTYALGSPATGSLHPYYGAMFPGAQAASFVPGMAGTPAGHGMTLPTAYPGFSPDPVPHPSEPESSFDCEPCDKSFKTEAQYKSHIKGHVKCKACNYEALAKILLLHEEGEHGLVNGVKKAPFVPTNTPEEIASWIQARKKRYPTDENVRLKQRHEEEEIKKGKVLSVSKRKIVQKHSCEADSKRSKTEPESSKPSDNPLSMLSSYDSNDESDGKSSSSSSDSDADSDDGGSDKAEIDQGDNEDDNSDRDQSSKRKSSDQRKDSRPKINRPCRYFLRGHCHNGDNCRFLHDPSRLRRPQSRAAAGSQGASSTSSPHDKLNAKPGLGDDSVAAAAAAAVAAAAEQKRRPGLLRMLLEQQIVQEKNTLLQCIRYIVEHDFFGCE